MKKHNVEQFESAYLYASAKRQAKKEASQRRAIRAGKRSQWRPLEDEK